MFDLMVICSMLPSYSMLFFSIFLSIAQYKLRLWLCFHVFKWQNMFWQFEIKNKDDTETLVITLLFLLSAWTDALLLALASACIFLLMLGFFCFYFKFIYFFLRNYEQWFLVTDITWYSTLFIVLFDCVVCITRFVKRCGRFEMCYINELDIDVTEAFFFCSYGMLLQYFNIFLTPVLCEWGLPAERKPVSQWLEMETHWLEVNVEVNRHCGNETTSPWI